MNRRVLLVLGAFLVMAGSVAVACSTDTDDLETRVAALEQQVGSSSDIAALQQQLEQASMVATLNLLDDVGFHEMNETIDTDEIAPAGTVGTIRTALRAVAATSWPEELDRDAADFQAKLSSFLVMLEMDESGSVLVDSSLVAHDGYHDFTDLGWTYLADQTGLDTSGDDDHDGMDMNSDMDGEDGMDEEPTP